MWGLFYQSTSEQHLWDRGYSKGKQIIRSQSSLTQFTLLLSIACYLSLRLSPPKLGKAQDSRFHSHWHVALCAADKKCFPHLASVFLLTADSEIEGEIRNSLWHENSQFTSPAAFQLSGCTTCNQTRCQLGGTPPPSVGPTRPQTKSFHSGSSFDGKHCSDGFYPHSLHPVQDAEKKWGHLWTWCCGDPPCCVNRVFPGPSNSSNFGALHKWSSPQHQLSHFLYNSRAQRRHVSWNAQQHPPLGRLIYTNVL